MFVFQVNGQKLQKDTTTVPLSVQNNEKLQLQLFLLDPQLTMPELWNDGMNLQGISIDKKTSIFNFNRELKYLNALNEYSSTLRLPIYLGLSDYQNFGGQLGSFNITKNLVIDHGVFISAQYGYLFSTKQIVFGNNFLLHYAITNKLQLQTWWQYITPGNSTDPTFNRRTFFPTTNYGAGLQYDSNKKTKIKVGIEYQYDQSDKIWKPESGMNVLLKF